MSQDVPASRRGDPDRGFDPADIDEVTSAMLTASRLLVAISARSLAAFEDTVTLPQFRLLVLLSSQGPAKLVTLANLLGVNPSTAMRMADRLATTGLVRKQASPQSGREIRIELTDKAALSSTTSPTGAALTSPTSSPGCPPTSATPSSPPCAPSPTPAANPPSPHPCRSAGHNQQDPPPPQG